MRRCGPAPRPVSPQTALTILSPTEWVYDDVGRVREEMRSSDMPGGACSYDAYGNSPQAGTGGRLSAMPGCPFDAETSLYHTPNRAYDQQDGR